MFFLNFPIRLSSKNKSNPADINISANFSGWLAFITSSFNQSSPADAAFNSYFTFISGFSSKNFVNPSNNGILIGQGKVP